MKRRKFIIGAGSIAAGSAAAIGTGAFTSVEADRGVTVNVAGDESALLALAPCDTGSYPNGEYASIQDGQFTLDIPNLNGNAFTRIDNVFRVTNQGTQPVVIYFQEHGGNTVAVDIGAKAEELDTGPYDEGTSGEGIDGDDVFDVSGPGGPGYGNNGIKLDDGNSIRLGVYADTSDGNVNDGVNESGGSGITGDVELWNSLTVHASAEPADSGTHKFVETDSA